MKIYHIFLIFFSTFILSSCLEDSDDIQRRQQEIILAEATAKTGMPAIVNFREKNLMKTILEMRDQEGLVTFTYLENMQPAVVKGKTALGGKLTYLGESIGYPIPYSTQYTNPEKYEVSGTTLPQADPNGLFSPSSAEASWILLKNPHGKEALPTYIEMRTLCSPFKFPVD